MGNPFPAEGLETTQSWIAHSRLGLNKQAEWWVTVWGEKEGRGAKVFSGPARLRIAGQKSCDSSLTEPRRADARSRPGTGLGLVFDGEAGPAREGRSTGREREGINCCCCIDDMIAREKPASR